MRGLGPVDRDQIQEPASDLVLVGLPVGAAQGRWIEGAEPTARVLLDALAGALRARGAVAAAMPAPVVVPAPVMPLAFTSALPVGNVEVPPDIVIAGGKVTEVKKVDVPSWEAPKVEQPAPVAGAVKRRAKGGK